MLHRSLAVALLALAAPLGAEPPRVLVCRGHEPEWSLRIDGATATLATLDTQGLTQTGLEGRLQEAGGHVPSFVYRGRTEASGPDLVAVITKEACAGTMADAAEGGGSADHSVRVSLPDGAVRLGCCTIPTTASPTPDLEPSPSPVVADGALVAPPVPLPVVPPPALAETTARGEITSLVLPDGRACQRIDKQRIPTSVYHGQRVSFDCGLSGGDTVVLIGPLKGGSEGLLTASKAVIEWRTGLGALPPVETTAARVSEVALSDQLTCRPVGRSS